MNRLGFYNVEEQRNRVATKKKPLEKLSPPQKGVKENRNGSRRKARRGAKEISLLALTFLGLFRRGDVAARRERKARDSVQLLQRQDWTLPHRLPKWGNRLVSGTFAELANLSLPGTGGAVPVDGLGKNEGGGFTWELGSC